ncbi:MAG TPA: helix-turn-helix domain-containing protein [Gemmatimonadales bacterium]|jgi:transcriptional regulator of acetoin/glycerol metabolism
MDAIVRAVLESLEQGIAVFDVGGGLVYANTAARRLLAASKGNGLEARRALLARQGRSVPLRDGETTLGEAVLIGGDGGTVTLAEQERQAILDALALTGGKLAEAARRLGISRTTLWRRLRSYGPVERPGAAS